MIGKLTGLVDSIGEDWALIDVSGVGYLAFCSRRTLSHLQDRHEPVALWIETHVREDHIHLYGFADEAERAWFRLLSTVQGVGAKMALSILSVLPAHELVQAIAAQDKAALTRANGVGPKLAARIVAELKDKVGDMLLGEVAAGAVEAKTRAAGAALDGVSEDAVSALVNLGYQRVEAYTAVSKAMREVGEAAPLEILIREGLKELAA